jgi:hypothetical protein
VWQATENKRVEMERAFDEYQKAGEAYERRLQQ